MSLVPNPRPLQVWLLILGTVALMTAAAAWADELKPRAVFPKPNATIINFDHDDPSEVVLKIPEGTHVRLRGGLLSFDPRLLTEEDRRRLQRDGLTSEQLTADTNAANALIRAQPGSRLLRLFAGDEAKRSSYSVSLRKA